MFYRYSVEILLGFCRGIIPVRGPTEHSLSYRGPTLEPSVPVLGGVRPRVKNAGFGPTFFRPSLPEGETQQTKKGTRDKCPISPTKSKSIGTEGSWPRTFPRVRRRGGPARGGSFPYALLLLSTTYASWWCQLAAPVYTETQRAIAKTIPEIRAVPLGRS